MWMTVLLLAITVNFEPTRIGLVPLLLARDKPLLQLWAFLAGSVTVSLTAGFLGQGPQATALNIAIGLAFLTLWVFMLREAERG